MLINLKNLFFYFDTVCIRILHDNCVYIFLVLPIKAHLLNLFYKRIILNPQTVFYMTNMFNPTYVFLDRAHLKFHL